MSTGGYRLGVDDREILLYEHAVLAQASLARYASESLDERNLVRALGDAAAQTQMMVKLDFYLAGFVLAAGNVSKLLWPSADSTVPERGPILRAIFGIPANSPLRDRALRNRLEHFDEDLDKYVSREHVEEEPFGWGVSRSLRSSIAHRSSGVERTRLTVVYRGREYDLLPYIQAIDAIVDS